MATAKRATSFKVVCPWCGDREAILRLNLHNIREVECNSCDESFSPETARRMAADALQRWDAVCQWVELGQSLLSEQPTAAADSIEFRPAV